MEERREKQIWHHKPISMRQCIKEVVACLKADKHFPHSWVPKKDGGLIDDPIVMGLVNDKKIIYKARAASPSDLTKITAQTEKMFSSSQ